MIITDIDLPIDNRLDDIVNILEKLGDCYNANNAITQSDIDELFKGRKFCIAKKIKFS